MRYCDCSMYLQLVECCGYVLLQQVFEWLKNR
ncbi:hypothetical protein DESC_860004 [Desulfosarcina cetonica]|nr:hypothetical protein DESC_860004 [Desulfosarcina cetonica]